MIVREVKYYANGVEIKNGDVIEMKHTDGRGWTSGSIVGRVSHLRGDYLDLDMSTVFSSDTLQNVAISNITEVKLVTHG
jgi:hypothetical protein